MVICETDMQIEACLSEHHENMRAAELSMKAQSDDEHQLKTLVNNQLALQPAQSSAVKLYNLDDVLSGFKLGAFHWRMLVLVGGGYFAACSEMMVFVFLSSPLKKEWSLGELDFSWLPFSTGIAGVCGGFLAGTVSDRCGRRVPFLVGIIIIGVAGFASAFAPNFPLFIACRCLVTIGIGTFESVGFVLLLEFLPRQQRGPVLVTVTLCGALGAVLAGGFAWLILPTCGWRWFVGACSSPAFLLLCYQPFVFFESPRFLLSSGKKQEAVNILKRMASMNNCELPNLDNIACPVSNRPRGNLQQLFSDKYLSSTLKFSAIWFLQASGYWGITVYLPEYMAKLGADPYFNMFSIFIGEIPGLLLAMLLIEHYMLGRIRTLRFFSAMTALSLFVFSFIPEHAFKTVLIILCYFSMVPIYSILNTVTPELYPTEVRSTAMAWVNILIEVPGLLTPFIGATLLSSDLPWLYPVVWGCVFFVQFAITFTLRNETAGRAIEDHQLNITQSEGI